MAIHGPDIRHINSVQSLAGSVAPAAGIASIHIFFGRALFMKYEKPAVQRFGTLRELTLGGGPQLSGDATNLYHRS